MADRRIKIAKDKSAFVESLADSADELSLFQAKADVIAYAASLGFNRKKRVPLEFADSSPIRKGVFETRGFIPLLYLIAVCEKMDLKVLAETEEAEEQRATIFEEYANGGLVLLEEQLKGVVDSGERISNVIQSLSKFRTQEGYELSDDLNISDLLI